MIKIVRANVKEEFQYLNFLKERAGEVQKEVLLRVEEIINNVKEKKDEALLGYTRQFDCPTMENIKVSQAEIDEAYEKIPEALRDALETAKTNITKYHKNQVKNSWIMPEENGVLMGQIVRGLEKVGVYVPGGTAAYPSSVLMNVIPAKLAGVEKVVMVTPPLKDGSLNLNILAAAKIAGVDEIYKVGGAQAVAALSYGTETVPKVDKIVGPGNIYVALAKKLCYGVVDIDMIAGPSEILIVSDDNGNAKFIAADLMSQAEHDKIASSILVTTSEELAYKVKEELERQVQYLERKDIIEESLKNYGAIVVVKSIEEAIEISNEIAPEHLELMLENPMVYLGQIKNAGSIFLGNYSPEPLGDYMGGPNHVLPTSGTARFFSPLSVDDFIKKSSYTYYSEAALGILKDKIVTLAESEGLTAHANSIKVRFED